MDQRAYEIAEKLVIASKRAYNRGIQTGSGGNAVSYTHLDVYKRQALVSDVYSATRARLSNDANIMCMGAFTTGKKVREMLVDAFFTNDFVPGCPSQPKVDAFVEYDNNR